MPKTPIKDVGGIDLRIRARGKDREAAEAARRELKRRLKNFEKACVPEWEKELRGPDPLCWEVV